MKKLLIMFFVIYFIGLLPGEGWGDVAKYQYGAIEGGFPLMAGKHPWYHLLTNSFNRLFPFGSVAWKINFLSCLLAILSLYAFIVYASKLGLRNISITFGVLTLGFSHTFWCMAEWAESYSLFSVLWIVAIGELLLYFKTHNKSHLQFGLLVLGFGMGNNLIQPFAAPAILATSLVHIKESRHVLYWLKPIFYGLLGMAPWLMRILYAWQIDGLNAAQLQHEAIDSKYNDYLFWNNSIVDIVKGLVLMGALCVYQFHACLWVLKQKVREFNACQLFLILLTVTITLFCSTYLRQRALWLMIAAYIPLAFMIMLAFDEKVKTQGDEYNTRWLALPFISPLIYLCAPLFLNHVHNPVTIEPMASRDDTKVFFQPWKHSEHSVKDFIDDVKNTLSKGDYIIADFTPEAALIYQQRVNRELGDIHVVNLLKIHQIPDIHTKNVYLARYNANSFKEELKKFPVSSVKKAGFFLHKVTFYKK